MIDAPTERQRSAKGAPKGRQRGTGLRTYARILSLELLCDHSIILWQCKLRFYDVKHHLHTN